MHDSVKTMMKISKITPIYTAAIFDIDKTLMHVYYYHKTILILYYIESFGSSRIFKLLMIIVTFNDSNKFWLTFMWNCVGVIQGSCNLYGWFQTILHIKVNTSIFAARNWHLLFLINTKIDSCAHTYSYTQTIMQLYC